MSDNYSLRSYLNSCLVLAEQRLMSLYTVALRKHVSKFGWPVHIIGQLEMVHINGAPAIAFPKPLEQEILRLNYGTQDTLLSPALSTFATGIR
jgi:hypothetical protein